MFVRLQAAVPNARGAHPGVFGLANGLARDGRLTAEDSAWLRAANDYGNAAYTDPTTVDPSVYDREINPGATAWFASTSSHLIEYAASYLPLLTRYGIRVNRVESESPGRVIYRDADQIVVVPEH